VYVLLGAPRFQHHVLDSIRQSRLLNPRLRIVLVADAALYEQRPEWPALLRGPGMRVRLVNASGLESDLGAAFRARYTQLWQELLTFRRVNEGMLPSVWDERGVALQNDAFTLLTAERLYVVHALMRSFALENVVHVENDQMLFGRGNVARAVAALNACGLRLALPRIGKRLSPAVVFARDAEALQDMLDFLLASISRGMDHAIKVVGSPWVTDMTLTAAYFALKRANTTTLPNHGDGSCLSRETAGMIFDAAPLGHWCCGSFEYPDEWNVLQDGESETHYWKTCVRRLPACAMRSRANALSSCASSLSSLIAQADRMAQPAPRRPGRGRR
jgi:hypothetical protein